MQAALFVNHSHKVTCTEPSTSLTGLDTGLKISIKHETSYTSAKRLKHKNVKLK